MGWNMQRSMIFAALMTVLLAGCSGSPVRLSNAPAPADHKSLGAQSCKSCGLQLFGVIPIRTRNVTENAYQCALEAVGGDEMIRPSVTNSWFWTPVGTGFCATVEGEVIKVASPRAAK